MNIQAVIFDMDGLMLDTEPLYRTLWQRAMRECGYSLTDEQFLKMVGRRRAETSLYLKEVFGQDLPLERIFDCCHALEGEVFAEPPPDKPGLRELLMVLEARGLPKAIATSTHRSRAARRLRETHLLERFDVFVAGDDPPIKHGKPAPDIFIEAGRQLQTEPARCLVLEDSLAGVAGGHAAGMQVVMVPDLLTPTAEARAQATRVCRDLHEVRALLDAS